MMSKDDMADDRHMVVSALSERNITATPQAVSTFVEMIQRSAFENIGSTDAILAGLLYSGSYTVDVLETAGANPWYLRQLASESSARSPLSDDEFDPIEQLFFPNTTTGFLLGNWGDAQCPIETADLLAAALTPDTGGDSLAVIPFPWHLRSTQMSSSALQQELDARVGEFLSFLALYLLKGDYATYEERNPLVSRRHAITKAEDWRLDKQLGADFPTMKVEELEFAIAALNHWFLHRNILTDPPGLCLQTLSRCDALLIAPQQFADAGGNIKTVDACLAMAKRFSPERDLAGLALFARDGEIRVGQYTYRNTFAVDTHTHIGDPFRRLSLQAIRPASLVSTSTIAAFEQLVSDRNGGEHAIQQFLESHRALLLALGYVDVHPHVCLREDGASDLIPDFLLELPGARGFNILDLKLPRARLAARRPYLRISSELTKALAQLRKYERYFERTENREAFHRRFGLKPFKPEIIVVIGRSSELRDRDDRVEIEAQLGPLRMLTYDELIDYGKSRSIYIPPGYE